MIWSHFLFFWQIVKGLFFPSLTPASGLREVPNHLVIPENQFLQTGSINEEMFIGVNKEDTLNFESVISFVRASFELASFDIILHKSRNGIDARAFSILFDAYNIQNLSLAELPDSGIWLSIQKACVDVSIGEAKAEANVNFHEVRAVMFRNKNKIRIADTFEEENAVIHSIDCICEASLSCCTFGLLLDCLNDIRVQIGTDSEISNINPESTLSFPSLMIDNLNSNQIEDEGSNSNIPAVAMLLINLTGYEIFIGTCSIKNEVSWACPAEKLNLSLSVGEDFQSITFQIQV